MREINVLEDPSVLDQVFPDQGAELLYEIVLEREGTTPSGDPVLYKIPIQYRVLSHVEIMGAYQAVTRRSKRARQTDTVLTVEDYSVQQTAVFAAAITNWEIVNLPRGKADKTRSPPQLSINELTTQEIGAISEALAPGLNKSGDDMLAQCGGVHRAGSKGLRADTVGDRKKSGADISV